MQKIVQDLPISVNDEGDDSADDNPKVSADDDSIFSQASGMPVSKQWTRGDRLRPSWMKCQRVRCTSASGKSWGASREQLTKAALREQTRIHSLQSYSVNSIAWLHHLQKGFLWRACPHTQSQWEQVPQSVHSWYVHWSGIGYSLQLWWYWSSHTLKDSAKRWDYWKPNHSGRENGSKIWLLESG